MFENQLGMVKQFLSVIRHCQVLGISAHEVRDHTVTLRLPYDDRIVGNPATGGIHAGVIAVLLDTTCGAAAVSPLPKFELCPTLDLRLDYMHEGLPGLDIYGFAECYRVSSSIIFTRGYAYQESPEHPIAHVVGTFMRLGKESFEGKAIAAGARV